MFKVERLLRKNEENKVPYNLKSTSRLLLRNGSYEKTEKKEKLDRSPLPPNVLCNNNFFVRDSQFILNKVRQDTIQQY